ncbi:NXPE family member 1-like [Dendropsophus ebraccatus]|uniref:NXPE family member 1-like n=1 Tax=Dendropsophus ebraccatus TaxID=150705 RepID=UPI003831ACB9
MEDRLLLAETKLGEIISFHNSLSDVCRRLDEESARLNSKITALEDYTRCNKLKLRNVPESIALPDLSLYVQCLLKHVLPPCPKRELVLDWVRRVPRPKHLPLDSPRDVIVRVHYLHVKNAFLTATRRLDKLSGDYQDVSCERPTIPIFSSSGKAKRISEIQKAVNGIYEEVDRTIPRTNITDPLKTSSAKHSKVFLKYPKDSYCVGDQIKLEVTMYDYLSQRKTYGGDYLRARMSTTDLGAASSGKIEDFRNGTYHVHFLLFWEGRINVTVFMMHPSEGTSALWTYRNNWHGYVDHQGMFEAPNQKHETECGFDLDQSKKLCDYKDKRDEEYFYCKKPDNYSCDSLTHVKSLWRHDKSLFTSSEKSFFNRSHVRTEIPKDFGHIHVSRCNNSISSLIKPCKLGTKLEYPSGYVMEDVWYPKGCSTLTYGALNNLKKCLKRKFIYLFGDSTLRQWLFYFQKHLKTLKPFTLYEDNWSRQLLLLDVKNNLKISWKRHTFPFISSSYQSWKEERTIAREIDLIRGDERTVIVLNIGVHFRSYPIYYFIKRLYNIRRAIERLFLRSPDTKVIIKTENTSPMLTNFETMSDFHASIHYFIMEIVFKNLNAGFVNGWDMTNAFDTNLIHPPETVIRNEVKMLMTYICEPPPDP